jgi:hypothetical protein
MLRLLYSLECVEGEFSEVHLQDLHSTGPIGPKSPYEPTLKP